MSAKMIAPFGLLAGLILLGLLVAGLVALIVFLSRKRLWWVLGIVVAVVGVLLMALPIAHVVGSRVAYLSRERDERAARAIERTMAVTVREQSLGLAETTALLADVYPSAAQAAKAAARQLARSVESVSDAALPVLRVHGRAPTELLSEVADAFRAGALVRTIEIATAPATQPRGRSDVNCSVRVDSGETGNVELVLNGPKGRITRSARFLDKPWVADFARYLRESRADCILARSGRLRHSPNDAERAALDDAARQLLVHIGQSLDRGMGSGRIPPGPRPEREQLRRMTRVELRRGGLVTDRFPQRFRPPSGGAHLWRQSLLVDCSPAKVDKLAATMALQAAGWRQARMSGWVRIIASIGGLALLIFVVYLVLNAATKGYYVWVLRVGAGVLVAAGVIAVLLLASHIDRSYTSLEVLQ